MGKGFTYLAPLAVVAPLVVATAALGLTFAAASCSSTPRQQFADDGGLDGQAGFVPGKGPCQGLECKRAVCPSGSETSITGKVYDPAGTNALYNVMVYIPGGPNGDAELPEIKEGVSCETCASVALSPMVSALTDTSGAFELKNVPVDSDIPIVIQVGKWRRKVKIDVTKKCEENNVSDSQSKDTFRLPKDGTEGDMPQIAVTAGAYDALECLLRGIGISDSEFVPGAGGAGHVHVFAGKGGIGVPGSPPAGGSIADPFGGELWNDVEKMKAYDMVLLSCEGEEALENKGGAVGRPGARQAMWDYANLGGKIFATHYHYSWFKLSPQPDWQGIADWASPSYTPGDLYDVDTSFPKGEAFAEWLVTANASATKGKIQLTDVTSSMSSVRPPGQSWVMKGSNAVKYFSFNAPTDKPAEEQCGRAVYSDLHVSGAGSGGNTFPGGCPASGGLSAQQKALEFMFFDLSGCVQADDTPPSPPK